jgi:hypothetical protein
MIRIYLDILREVRKHQDRPNECHVRFKLGNHTCIKYELKILKVRLGKERLDYAR